MDDLEFHHLKSVERRQFREGVERYLDRRVWTEVGREWYPGPQWSVRRTGGSVRGYGETRDDAVYDLELELRDPGWMSRSIDAELAAIGGGETFRDCWRCGRWELRPDGGFDPSVWPTNFHSCANCAGEDTK